MVGGQAEQRGSSPGHEAAAQISLRAHELPTRPRPSLLPAPGACSGDGLRKERAGNPLSNY